jgi:hypothetical protein
VAVTSGRVAVAVVLAGRVAVVVVARRVAVIVAGRAELTRPARRTTGARALRRVAGFRLAVPWLPPLRVLFPDMEASPARAMSSEQDQGPRHRGDTATDGPLTDNGN